MPSDEPRRAPPRAKAPPAAPARPAPASRPGRPAPQGGAGPSRSGRPGRKPGAAAAAAAASDQAQGRWVTVGLLATLVGIALLVVRLLTTREKPAESVATAPPNRPPEVQSLELTLSRSNVVARAVGRDLDGDGLRYQFRWTVAGKALDTEGALLSRRLAPPGTTVEVEATPVDDRGAKGRPMRSNLTLDDIR